MELLITSKHYDLDDEERELAGALARKLDESYVKLNTLRLVLNTERGRAIVDALLNGKNVNLNAKARAGSMSVSITNAIEKLDKQMRRYLEKIQDLSVKPDPGVRNKIWTSEELVQDEDNADLVD